MLTQEQMRYLDVMLRKRQEADESAAAARIAAACRVYLRREGMPDRAVDGRQPTLRLATVDGVEVRA